MTVPAIRTEPGFDRVAFARRVLEAEGASLLLVAARLDDSFERLVEKLGRCTGRVAVTGIGKSADVGQKLVGTLNSTGTRAYLLDATRAVHGDLGMVHPDDVALLLSHSGESEELLRLVTPLRSLAAAVTAITGNAHGTLAKSADAAVVYGPITEACPLSLAPSTSTTVMLALGDAIAFTLSELRQFTAEEFAKFHPAGTLGRKLASVEVYMRRSSELRLASADDTVRQVFAKVRHRGRRTGAVMLVDDAGKLSGLFTDSDLARLFENHADGAFDQPIAGVMTANPITLLRTARMGEAMELLRTRKISELPIIDEEGRPVGLLDITDLIGVDPTTPELRLLSPPVCGGIKGGGSLDPTPALPASGEGARFLSPPVCGGIKGGLSDSLPIVGGSLDPTQALPASGEGVRFLSPPVCGGIKGGGSLDPTPALPACGEGANPVRLRVVE